MTARTVFTPQKNYFSDKNQQWLEHLRDETDPQGFIVKTISPYIGKGVFATQKFRHGSFLMEYHGDYISNEEAIARERDYPVEYGSFLVFFKHKRKLCCIDATFSKQIGRYVNDGTDTEKNAQLKLFTLKDRPHVVLVASRNIVSGEEIRFNYGVDDLPWRKCKTCTVLLKRCDEVVSTNQLDGDGSKSGDEGEHVLEEAQPRIFVQKRKRNYDESQITEVQQIETTCYTYLPTSHLKADGTLMESGEYKDDVFGEIEHNLLTQEEESSEENETKKCNGVSTKDPGCLLDDRPECAGDSDEHSDLKVVPTRRLEHDGSNSELEETEKCETENTFLIQMEKTNTQFQTEDNRYDDPLSQCALLPLQQTESTYMPASQLVGEDSNYGLEDVEERELKEMEHEYLIQESNKETDSRNGLARCPVIPSAVESPSMAMYPLKKRIVREMAAAAYTNTESSAIWNNRQGNMMEDNTLDNPYSLTRQTFNDDCVVLIVSENRESANRVSSQTANDCNTEEETNKETDSRNGLARCPVIPSAVESPSMAMYPLKKRKSKEQSAELGKQIVQDDINERQKPKRPCPFCGKFRARLTDHMKTKHKSEKEVKEAIILPPHEKLEAFVRLRKRGIYIKNLSLIGEEGCNRSAGLIRERRQGKDKLVMCSSCKAFLSKKQFYKHKRMCNKSSLTNLPPSGMESCFFLEKTKTKENYGDFEREVLSRFRNDGVGEVCKTDTYISLFGYKKFLSLGSKYSKRDEKRKSSMSHMRCIAKCYIDFKEQFLHATKNDAISFPDMFKRENFKYLKEVLYARKCTLKADSNLMLGNVLKKFAHFLRDYMVSEGKDEIADEISKFLSTLKYNWAELFNEAEYEVMMNRSETRKPSQLPDEDNLKLLTIFIGRSLQEITEDSYNFIAESEFTFLRDLAVCRLTLFNARRGGEPSRLTISEWHDAENNVWLHKDTTGSLGNSTDSELLKKVKVTYQVGKRDGKLVPVIFPEDCLPAIRLLADPMIRKDAHVNNHNAYLFPRTQLSDKHVVGSDSIRNVCNKAGVDSVTATEVRHRVATIYAAQDTGEQDREAFFKHMGHSGSINKHIYQCPPAHLEVTKVGQFFHKLDKELRQEAASTSTLRHRRTSESLKEFLYILAETNAVDRVLVHAEELIQENEVETKPEEITCITYDESLINDARSLFSDDAWLAVASTLSHARAATRPDEDRRDQLNQEMGVNMLQVNQPVDQQHMHNDFTDIPKDDSQSVEDTQMKKNIDFKTVRQKDVFKTPVSHKTEHSRHNSKDIERQYNRWTKDESRKVNNFFSEYVYDVSRTDAKGALPGYKNIRRFLKMNKDIFPQLLIQERIRTVHTKINNERNKVRRRAEELKKSSL